MALTITEKNGVFIVEGAINASTSKSLMNHCKSFLNACGEVIIDLQHIAFINVDGLLAIKSLYEFASKSQTYFHVVGDGNAKTTNKKFELAA